ncbi:FtsW/RodA/SpoVE family cell division protein [Sporosarcina newyorkensis 2681]|uniref:FtsW/RodA/SpoVE family cell division protein n=1 Tax=Sporosarcina newyorkensis 2681 TaxID=1027292 RepID=F9DTS2_9BACL|nr:FtsW/RodA/SpoVE family cell division protein [Sporosarcina newyorkensis 2681]
MKQTNRLGERFDWTLAFIIMLFGVISLVVIGSAQTSEQYTQNFVIKQVTWYVLGSFIVAMVMYFEPDQYKKIAWYVYGFGIFLLLFLMLAPGGPGQIAEMRYSAKRWLHLPVIGTIQPAEFIKTFFILGLARMVSSHNEKVLHRTYQSDLKLLGKIALMLVVPLFFIMKQPDLGTSLVFVSITAAVVIVSGISWKLLAPLFSIGAALAASVLWMAIYAQDFLDKIGFSPYQFNECTHGLIRIPIQQMRGIT